MAEWEEAARFVLEIRRRSKRANRRWASKDMVYGIWRDLAVVLARENGDIINEGLNRARDRDF